jgi:hypothetical protein
MISADFKLSSTFLSVLPFFIRIICITKVLTEILLIKSLGIDKKIANDAK